MPRTLIAECKIDGTPAYSFVDLDKASGNYLLNYQGRGPNAELQHAIFSDYSQVEKAASWAVDSNKGGFKNVSVHNTDRVAEFATAEEWFFD